MRLATLRAMGAARAALLAGVAAAAAAGPVEARTDPCARRAAPAFAIDRAAKTTALVRCDRGRTARVLRRVRAPRTFGDVAVEGRLLVWSEVIRRRGRTRAWVVSGDRRAAGERRRRVRPPSRGSTVEVAALRDGSIAWWSGYARRAPILVARPGRRPERVGETSEIAALEAEDGRTLRWYSGVFQVTYHDVIAPPVVAGCPRRGRFGRVLDTGEHLVTQARYRGEFRALRVCLRGTGRDHVVIVDGEFESVGFGAAGVLTLLAGRWAVTSTLGLSRYEGCTYATVRTTDLLTGRTGRRATAPCADRPQPGAPQAVTPSGGVAWLTRSGEADVLRAAVPDGQAVELDRGEPGTIADLRADGETYRWTRAGEPRSAPAP